MRSGGRRQRRPVGGKRPSSAKMAATSRANRQTDVEPPILPARDFFRIVRAPDGRVQAQTAVLTLQRRGTNERVHIVATVHVGEAAYFQAVERACAASDACVFELIVDDALRRRKNGAAYELRQAVDPSPDARFFASRHGLQCQLACIEFRRRSWFIGDMSREEWLAMAGDANGERLPFGNDDASATEPVLSSALGGLARSGLARRWGRWSRVTAPSGIAAEPAPSRIVGGGAAALARNVLAVFARGPMYSPSSAAARSQYASDSRTVAARLGLSVLFPCPEVVLVGFDYATLGPTSASAGIALGGGNDDISNDGAVLTAPSLLTFIVERLVSLDVMSARRAVLAQVLDQRYRLSGCVEDVVDATIGARNARAVSAVQSIGKKDVSIMYGVNHCRELSFRMQRDAGYEPVDVEWLEVFSCGQASDEDISGWRQNAIAWLTRGAILPSWLFVGAVDWTDFVRNLAEVVASSSDDVSTRVAASLYVIAYGVRHAVLYAIVSSWALVW
ncbi:hypothetical protein NFJ02_01g39210 [Pycnococcus provasolii]